MRWLALLWLLGWGLNRTTPTARRSKRPPSSHKTPANSGQQSDKCGVAWLQCKNWSDIFSLFYLGERNELCCPCLVHFLAKGLTEASGGRSWDKTPPQKKAKRIGICDFKLLKSTFSSQTVVLLDLCFVCSKVLTFLFISSLVIK